MSADNFIFFNNTLPLIIGGVIGLFGLVALCILFFVSRRSQRVMNSLLTLMTSPERVKVADAARVLHTILSDEISRIDACFQNIRDTLNLQIAAANELKQQLTVQNDALVDTADAATKKMATMSQRLDNTVSGLGAIIESNKWSDVESATDKFSATVNELMTQIENTTTNATARADQIKSQIDAWIESGKQLSAQLSDEFTHNDEQMHTFSQESESLRQQLSELAQSTATGFEQVKSSAAEYNSVMENHEKSLDAHLNKLDAFGKQAKKQLTSQMNTLTNTANVVGGQVRLAESSVEKQIRKLSDAVETLMSSATGTESAVRGITTELSTLTNKFNGEIKEFATGVVGELKTVSGVANTTLENTRNAATAFSESVRAMATGVRETLIEMNTAHTQLSGQSENLIKMSAETTAQLQPLSELIERYFAALPDLSSGSAAASENLEKIVQSLNDHINQMKTTVSESTDAVANSAAQLQDLAGQSRQQMIDLMSDYAKAVNTMQTLNKQMMVARATTPMEAINVNPNTTYGRVSGVDFLAQTERMTDKMHELSLDLTRASGAEIPDVVWKKYHAGDKKIFSKWLAKMLGAADKKQIRDLLKSDAVFRSQANQFVRSFDKILTAAQSADNADKVSATLLKTDLGRVYTALRGNI